MSKKTINTEQVYREEKIDSGKTDEPKEIKKQILPHNLNSFKAYMVENRTNYTLLWVAGIGIVLQFIIFKHLYPYAGFISGDSYIYLRSASLNQDINLFSIGYSKFLRLFNTFTKSDTALVAFQYLSIQLTALWFIFTLFYFYLPSKLTKWAMFILVVFNPVFLYISNYISSDSLFLALSLAWFTLLLWILRQPTLRLVLLQILVLILAFSVRYNALYYPLIAAMALLLSRQPLKMKIASIGASFLVIGAFMLYTANQFKELTGILEFIPFSGWQIANNSMYAYRYVNSSSRKKASGRLEALDKAVCNYFDTSRDIRKHPEEMLIANTEYMWDRKSPLIHFMNDQFKKDSLGGYLKRWASVAPLYSDYGYYLIKQYPMTYLKYYLWPNAIKYYAPPGEFLNDYNMGRDTIEEIGRIWFGYKTNKIKTAFKDPRVTILGFLPILSGVMNVLFLLGLLHVMTFKGFHGQSLLTGVLVLAGILWLVNFVFSVFAAPITLRYQLFGILVFSSLAFILSDYIYKKEYGQSA
jgi:hypothetical protein